MDTSLFEQAETHLSVRAVDLTRNWLFFVGGPLFFDFRIYIVWGSTWNRFLNTVYSHLSRHLGKMLRKRKNFLDSIAQAYPNKENNLSLTGQE